MTNLLIAPLTALALALAITPASAQVRVGGFIGVELRGRHPLVKVSGPIFRPTHRCVEGHWETVEERVWVAGECIRVWVAPCYEERVDRCGRHHRVLVREGYWREEQLPGHWETRCRRVWVPGCGCRH